MINTGTSLFYADTAQPRAPHEVDHASKPAHGQGQLARLAHLMRGPWLRGGGVKKRSPSVDHIVELSIILLSLTPEYIITTKACESRSARRHPQTSDQNKAEIRLQYIYEVYIYIWRTPSESTQNQTYHRRHVSSGVADILTTHYHPIESTHSPISKQLKTNHTSVENICRKLQVLHISSPMLVCLP